jgi:hypothetical protein
MKKTVRYYPYTPQEIEVFKKETDKTPYNKEDMTNAVLISIRRNYLNNTQNDLKLISKVKQFNQVVKDKRVEELAKLIRYFLNH